jgi:hypothetical protein
LGCRHLSPAGAPELDAEVVAKMMVDLQFAPCKDFVVIFYFSRDLSVNVVAVILNPFQI